jgi:hypothetical protein
MSPDEQEARSRRYAHERIVLLPLSSGNIAVFNCAGDLCGIEAPERWKHHVEGGFIEVEMLLSWHPPATRARPSLEELGL